jgi:VWFA-related protein
MNFMSANILISVCPQVSAIRHLIPGFAFIILLFSSVNAQTNCFSDDDTKRIVNSIANPQKLKDAKALKTEILKLDERRKSLENDILKSNNDPGLLSKRNAVLVEGIQRLCVVFKENGWLSKESLGQDGFSAVIDIIFNVDQPNIQRQFLPILLAAAEKSLVPRSDIATLVDSIRIKSGLRQLFGTYLTLSDGIAYLYPLENQKLVDEWRKAYQLPTLNSFMREIETKYQTLVVRRNSPKPKLELREATAKVLGLEEEETIKISTNLVNLKVRVIGDEINSRKGIKMSAADFILTEDNKAQDISFFEKNNDQIDYYLVLDLSGSTARIRESIWKTVGILGNLIKSGDRITVLTHIDGKLLTILNLTNNQTDLSETVAKFKGLGTSSIWDALSDSFNLAETQSPAGRAPVMILVSDALEANSGLAFGNLLDRIKENEITVFPIQLPTDYLSEDPAASEKRLRVSRKAFELLAQESGGEYFNIKNEKDLLSIPQKITSGLGEIYNMGFEPKNTDFDGSWRQLNVKTSNQTSLKLRAKTGYYAKPQ